MLNHVAAGPFGLGQRSKGRAANLDCGLVVVERTPTRQVAGASVEARTSRASETDHEREAVTVRTPDLHVPDGPIELQWHRKGPL